MIENGTIGDAENIELIEGLLVTKMGRNRPHVQAGKKGLAVLLRIAPPGWHVAKEDPVRRLGLEQAGTGPRPGPRPRRAITRARDVTAGDIGLIIEIADSSLAADREVMGRLDAAGGIPVYWIVNLVDQWIETYTSPDPTSGYQSRVDYRPGEEIPVVIDGQEVGRIAVTELLP